MFQLTPKYDCMFDATEAMFHLLSEYDGHFNSEKKFPDFKKKSKYSLNIKITDTIVYKSGIPISWFYLDNEKIHHKTNYKDIKMKDIVMRCLGENTNNPFGIVAYYLSEESIKNSYRVNDITEVKVLSKTIQKVNMEYCSKDNINYYINIKKKTNGLFQNFIYPFSDKHNIYEVYWNDHVISVTKRSNTHYLDEKLPVEEKLFTFEADGAMHISQKNMANTRIAKKLKELCEEIKHKVNYIYYYKEYTVIKGYEFRKESDYNILKGKEMIKSFKFHAKMDNEFNFIIMYFLNLELKIMSNNNINSSQKQNDFLFLVEFFKPKQHSFNKLSVNYAKEHNLTRKNELKGKTLCKGCDHYTNIKEMHEITYKIIIKNHELRYQNNKDNKTVIEYYNKFIKEKYSNQKDRYNSNDDSLYENYIPNNDNHCISYEEFKNSNLKEYIPDLIFKLEKNIRIDLYLKMKDYSDFLKTKQEICTECYLNTTKL